MGQRDGGTEGQSEGPGPRRFNLNEPSHDLSYFEYTATPLQVQQFGYCKCKTHGRTTMKRFVRGVERVCLPKRQCADPCEVARTSVAMGAGPPKSELDRTYIGEGKLELWETA